MVFSIIARKGRTKKTIAATLAIIVATMSVPVMSISNAASAKETAVQTTDAATPQANKLITEFILEQRGSEVYHARNILKTSTLGTELLPTGVAALAGEEIKVYVTNVESVKLLPKITFTQQVGYWGNWKRTYTLKPGVNTFKVPKIYDNKWKTKVIPGGAIYMENPYTAIRQGKAPHIRIEGGHKYPLFRDGDNVEQFMQELKDYKTKLKNNKNKYVDIVELVNDYVILNSNMASAEAAFMKKGSNQTPQGTLNFHKERMSQLLAYAGIGETGDIKHRRNRVRANMRLMQPWALAYAYGDHTGFQQAAANSLFQGKTYGWAIAHELGHHYDIQGGHIKEITNNMWANYNNVDLQNDADRMANAYATIFKKHASDDHATLTKANTVNGLAMWWQLHLLNENYWPNYQAAYRNGIADKMGLTKHERMAAVSSYALGMDITEHFVRYKFITEKSAQKVSNALKKLNVPAAAENIKPWYMWTKATKDRESVFENVYTPEIVSVKQNAGKVVMQLNIDKSAQKALLGYEIVRDDKVLGFTNTNTFTSNVAVDGLVHTYRVRAFDLRSNATMYSAPVAITDSTYKMNPATVTTTTYSTDSVTVTTSTYSIEPVTVTNNTYSIDVKDGNLTDAVQVTDITLEDIIGPTSQTTGQIPNTPSVSIPNGSATPVHVKIVLRKKMLLLSLRMKTMKKI